MPHAMNITLAADLAAFVQLKLDSGRYHSASQVVGEALRLLAERDELVEHRKQEIRSGIAAGLCSLRRGEGIDGDEFFAQLEREERELERNLQSA